MPCGCPNSVCFESLCPLLSQRRMFEPVLLVILVLISATTTTVNANELDICNRSPQEGQFEFSYRILDEFGDEASMLFWNGQLELTCGSSQFNVDFFVGLIGLTAETKITKAEDIDHTATTTTMKLAMKEASKENLLWPPHSVYCTCPDGSKGKGRKSQRVSIPTDPQYPVCSEAERKNCSGKQICVLDKTGTTVESTQSACKTLASSNCHLTIDSRRRGKAMYKEVCISDGNIKQSECEAVVEAQSTGASKWPMVEAERCNNNKLLKFWKGNHALRDNILIADIFTLTPADKNLCYQGTIECHLHFKLESKKKKKDVHGNCNDGWTVRARDISEEEKTKLHCVYTAETDSRKFRWQFYLHNAKVEVVYEGSEAKCSWPKWAMAWTGGKNVTDPVDEKCEKSVTFSYPLKQIGKRFSLAYRKGLVTDIPTTTQPTTAQPARNATEATPDEEGKSKSSSPVGQLGTGSSTEHQKGETTTEEEAATKPSLKFLAAPGFLLLIIALSGIATCLGVGILACWRRMHIREELEKIEAARKEREEALKQLDEHVSGRSRRTSSRSRRSGRRTHSSRDEVKEEKSEKDELKGEKSEKKKSKGEKKSREKKERPFTITQEDEKG